jgi:hypothetical protein
MDERRKALEEFAQMLSEGMPQAADYVDVSGDAFNNALEGRDLAETSLAHQVLKNTGVPIPGKGATTSQQEDFFNRIMKERYPELEPNVIVNPKLKDAEGTYNWGKINLNGDEVKKNPIEHSVGKLLHEGAHQYDDQHLKNAARNPLDLSRFRDAQKAGVDVKRLDPTDAYELLAKGHHQNIPKLREGGTFGVSALKSMMKNGTFKALPLVGPAIGAAMALGSDDASAAIPVLNEAESVGMSPEDENIMLAEIQAKKNYTNSPASQARREALKKLKTP